MQQTAYSQWPEGLPLGAILHLKQPGWPQFRFEWHPQTQRVYYLRTESPKVGRLLALDIDTEGRAITAVLIFLRGYQESRDGRDYTVTEGAA
jgi:hypothetical protein